MTPTENASQPLHSLEPNERWPESTESETSNNKKNSLGVRAQGAIIQCRKDK